MKEDIEQYLKSTDRKGVENLISFLNTSDFYIAPCSTKFHLACKGGLAKHTLNVLCCAMNINSKYDKICRNDSIIIASIGHDLCKVNFYEETNEAPTDAQAKYLRSLMLNAGLKVPPVLNKTYASNLIDFMLKKYKSGLGIPEFSRSYVVKDQLPLGHGEKSLFVIQQFIDLTVEEALSIRWHMSAWDLNLESMYQKNTYNEAVKMSKLVSVLTLADIEATHLMEAE